MAYEDVTFKTLKPKRLETVRERIKEMWVKDSTISASTVSKKLRISSTSARTALGNLTRQNT